MKYQLRIPIAIIVISLSSCHNFKNQPSKRIANNSDLIFAKGEKITNDNFTGTAYLHPMITADSLNFTSVGNVTFKAGARTKWHLHPGGQILLVTGGTGYYQEKGSPKRIIKKGESIKCPPGVPHWHGASKDEELIQVAITNTQKGATVWLEPVSDEEYNSFE
ncbi:cupin domain-containing protein [Flavihumibacter sp. R14]|nr:cupin domain-containing protein [Flavihumibacter soli]